MTLEPGLYTAIVQGVGATTGVALVEAYDLDRTVDSKLANISTRGFVQTGDNVMIGGLIILGDTDSAVLVRAIGPALADVGVDGALEDPILELHDKDGSLIVSNDDWKTTQQTDIEATGLAPSDDRESSHPGNPESRQLHRHRARKRRHHLASPWLRSMACRRKTVEKLSRRALAPQGCAAFLFLLRCSSVTVAPTIYDVASVKVPWPLLWQSVLLSTPAPLCFRVGTSESG